MQTYFTCPIIDKKIDGGKLILPVDYQFDLARKEYLGLVWHNVKYTLYMYLVPCIFPGNVLFTFQQCLQRE